MHILQILIKTSNIIFPSSYFRSRLQVARAYSGSLGHQGRPHPGQDTLPSQGHSHIHMHSDWDNEEMGILLIWSLGCGRKTESHPDMERTCKLHKGKWPQMGILFFCPPTLINIIKLEAQCIKFGNGGEGSLRPVCILSPLVIFLVLQIYVALMLFIYIYIKKKEQKKEKEKNRANS